jgi:Outer membrane protein beta-barrel domain
MKRTVILSYVVASAFVCLSASAHRARAQSEPPKFEVGGQFSLLNFDPNLIDRSRRNEVGGGGRFTFNFHKYVAAEAQFDYFPKSDTERIGTITLTQFGSKAVGVFGVKAGARKKSFGIFGKARPGFIHFSTVPGFLCVASPCPQPAKTNFAFDVGGVIEYYPSKRVVLRFDAGDLIIHYQRFFGTDHNLQISAGVGVRF